MTRVLRFSPAMLLIFVAGCFNANPADSLHNMPQGTGFSVRTVKVGNDDHKYGVFVPRDYSPSKKYPTIVFLHGIGEAGGDGVKCTTVGLGPAIGKRDGNFPFIVIFPQTGWNWCSDESGQICINALDDAEKQYSIDQDRVTLTGMSSGGEGVWALGAKYVDRWNALVPMGGYAHDEAIPVLVKAHMPVWALHNSGDFFVPVGGSRSMIKKLHDGGLDDNTVRYTEYDEMGHDCWDKAYDSGELFTWLQQQHRSAHAAVKQSAMK